MGDEGLGLRGVVGRSTVGNEEEMMEIMMVSFSFRFE